MPAALDALKRTPRYVIRYGLTLAIIVASYFALRPLGVSLHPAVSILFGIDPAAEPERARRIHDSHLDRAKWMTQHGYRELAHEQPRR